MEPVIDIEKKWFRVCKSEDLKDKPVSKKINGIPVVLFRGEEKKVGVLLDRCPHRNIQMSKGYIENETLVCRHHGWHFDTEGICVKVPQLKVQKEDKDRNAIRFNSLEKDGFIYVNCDASPKDFPQIKARPAEIKYRVPQPTHKGFLRFFLKLWLTAVIFGLIIYIWFNLVPFFLFNS
jgi:phenylpropionate dioxygenase-like ring-hydroxylating dioxygenase large terminal subunit